MTSSEMSLPWELPDAALSDSMRVAPWDDDDFDFGLGESEYDSDLEEDGDEMTPGGAFVEYVMNLWYARALSDKQNANLMWYAKEAGIKEAEPYSLPPTSSYGHHGRKLRNKLGWTRSNKDSPFSRLSLRRWFVLLYTHLNHGVVRVVGHVLRSIDIVDAYTVSERFFHVRRIGLVAVSDRFLRSCNVNCVAVVVVLSIVHA